MDEVVVADNLRKSYGRVTALDGVSLRVRKGEIFGLIGPDEMKPSQETDEVEMSNE